VKLIEKNNLGNYLLLQTSLSFDFKAVWKLQQLKAFLVFVDVFFVIVTISTKSLVGVGDDERYEC
jgi:hypothetical protein